MLEIDEKSRLLPDGEEEDAPAIVERNGHIELPGTRMDLSEGVYRGKNERTCERVVHKLFRRKKIEDILAENIEDHEAGEGLDRSLSLFDLIAYGIGSTIGAGLFVVTGKAAKDLAGPAVTLSFLLAGFAGLLSAFCYAEFATRVPVAGSAYSFAYVCFGEAVAWFIGWNLTLEYGISASAVARAWADYFVNFLRAIGCHVPKWVHEMDLNVPLLSEEGSPLAVLIVLVCTGLLLMGASGSARLNLIITCLNGALILFIIVVGSSEVDTGNWKDFNPKGFSGVMSGAAFVFFSYIGFDCVCTLSEEMKNPKKDLPIAIVGTLLIVSTLYIVVSLVLTGMISYQDLNISAPLSDAFNRVGMHWAGVIVALGTTTTLSSTTLCALFGQPRVFFAMAKDGLVHKRFARLNPKTKVPEFSTYVCGLVSAVLAFCFDIDLLAGMISVGTLLSFTVVCLGILIVRYQPAMDMPLRNASLFTNYFFWLIFFCGSNLLFNLGIQSSSHMPVALIIIFGVLLVIPVVALALLPQNPIKNTRAEENSKSGALKGSIFPCPLVPWIPCLGVIINTHLILSLQYVTLLRLGVWTGIGFVIYFAFGIHHSKLNATTDVTKII